VPSIEAIKQENMGYQHQLNDGIFWNQAHALVQNNLQQASQRSKFFKAMYVSIPFLSQFLLSGMFHALNVKDQSPQPVKQEKL